MQPPEGAYDCVSGSLLRGTNIRTLGRALVDHHLPFSDVRKDLRAARGISPRRDLIATTGISSRRIPESEVLPKSRSTSLIRSHADAPSRARIKGY